MKSFAFVVIIAQAVFFNSAYSQYLRSSRVVSPIVAPAILPTPCSHPIIPPCSCSAPAVVSAPFVTSPVMPAPVVVPNVANNLADTLSLLTVSSLLADTLPLNYPVIGGCGCGSCGSGCGCGHYTYVV